MKTLLLFTFLLFLTLSCQTSPKPLELDDIKLTLPEVALLYPLISPDTKQAREEIISLREENQKENEELKENNLKAWPKRISQSSYRKIENELLDKLEGKSLELFESLHLRNQKVIKRLLKQGYQEKQWLMYLALKVDNPNRTESLEVPKELLEQDRIKQNF